MTTLAGQSDVEAVRNATDLVRLIGEHVMLRPRGREHVGLCPFHDDKNPSFAVVTHKGNAFYKCHACGAGGDAFDFVMQYHRMDFGEALRFLADRAGITLKLRQSEHAGSAGPRRMDLRKANAFAATFFQRVLNAAEAGAKAREVIAQRKISDEMVRAFSLGAAADQWDALATMVSRRNLPADVFKAAGLLKQRREGDGLYDAFRNRLIFPICDELGNPIAFGARKINPEDEPKYLNSAESALFSKSKTLYGLHLAKRSIIDSKQAIITEGYTDVIACHQAGIGNVVGTLGTALTTEHARILKRLCDTVVLVFDGDEAGQKAADRALEVFFAEPVDVRICVLPDGLDPDELLKQPEGRERFEQAIAASRDAMEFKISRFQAQLQQAAGISARQKLLENFLNELAQLGFAAMPGVRKRLVLTQLADMLGVGIADIEAAMPRSRRPVQQEAAVVDTSVSRRVVGDEDAAVSRARRIAERDLLAVLIYQPELHCEQVDGPDGSRGAVTDVFDAADFADPVSRSVAEAVFALLRTTGTLTVQQLLAQLEQPEARSLASTLYFEGQQRCESPILRETTPIAAAAKSLRAHIDREQYEHTVSSFRQIRNTPEQAIAALQNILEERRRIEQQQGAIASAIPRGVRS